MNSIPVRTIYSSQTLNTFLSDPAALFPNKNNAQAANPCVVTGQQIGLLGGPFYTLLKICSARAAALQYSRELNKEVETVFWLEDTDHDSAEAATLCLPSSGRGVEKTTIWDGSSAQTPVAQRTFSKSEVDAVHNLLSKLDGRYAQEVVQQLRELYAVGASWSDAFLKVIAPFIEAWNVRVVRGSEVLKSGIHSDVVRENLKSRTFEKSILDRTAALEAAGHRAQATVPDVLFFFHTESGRCKLTRDGENFVSESHSWTRDELLSILETNPERFSPSVLIRPIVQDMYLKPIASVLGPAEIAYQAQLTNLYALVGIQQPSILLRHTACLLDGKSERNAEKSGWRIEQFFHHWDEVERTASQQLAERHHVPPVDSAAIALLAAPFKKSAEEIDPTLVKTVEAMRASIEASAEVVERKLVSAVKRANTQVMERLRGIWDIVYPDSTINERVYPLSMWEARMGTDAVRIIAERICEGNRDELVIIGPSDVEEEENRK